MMRRGATPARYSRIPSRTRSRCSGEGLPSGKRGGAEDDDDIETLLCGVVVGDGAVANDDGDHGEQGEAQDSQNNARSRDVAGMCGAEFRNEPPALIVRLSDYER